MCERCDELDAQIEKYTKLKAGFSDQKTLDAINALLEKLKSEKKALHAE